MNYNIIAINQTFFISNFINNIRISQGLYIALGAGLWIME